MLTVKTFSITTLFEDTDIYGYVLLLILIFTRRIVTALWNFTKNRVETHRITLVITDFRTVVDWIEAFELLLIFNGRHTSHIVILNLYGTKLLILINTQSVNINIGIVRTNDNILCAMCTDRYEIILISVNVWTVRFTIDVETNQIQSFTTKITDNVYRYVLTCLFTERCVTNILWVVVLAKTNRSGRIELQSGVRLIKGCWSVNDWRIAYDIFYF